MDQFFEYKGYSVRVWSICGSNGKWCGQATYGKIGSDDTPESSSFVPSLDSEAEADRVTVNRVKQVIDQKSEVGS